MRKIYFIAALLIFALSCDKADEPDYGGPMLTFRAMGGDEAETRTALRQNGGVVWSPSDEIMIYYGTQSGKFTSTNTSETSTAEFKGRLGALNMDGNESFLGVYPYSAARSNDVNAAGDGFSAYLPYQQTAVEGGFADDLFLSAARSLNFDLYFYNLCGGIKFSVAVPGIVRIAFTANGKETLAGTGYYDFPLGGVPSFSHTGSDGRDHVVVSAPDGGTFKPGVWYYMVMFPRKLSQGYTIDLYNASNLAGTITSSKGVTVKRATWGILKDLDPADNNYVPMEAVDLGLSVPWANLNLGAKALNDFGEYYSWGETTPSKGTYTWSNYKWGNPSKGFSKYTPSGKTVLDPEDDAATQKLGGKWRMATIEEFKELYQKCQWEKTTIDGVVCYKVIGPNGNYIYLPAFPGYYDGGITERGVNGYYWSSTLLVSEYDWAQNLWFKNGISISKGQRYYGEVIRPVYADRSNQGAELHSTPNALDFGIVNVGSSVSKSFQVTNSGTSGTQMDMIIPEGFSVTPAPQGYINAGGTKTFTVTFTPAEAKDYSDYIHVTFDGGVAFVTLTAAGEGSSGYAQPEAVDLGLSSKWASFNLGAASPEQFGNLFAWGEVETKTDFSWSNYRWGSSPYNITKYWAGRGVYILAPEDDAATANLGGQWRMPSGNDIWELTVFCTWTKTTSNGVQGFKVSRNGKSIFIPSTKDAEELYWTASIYAKEDSSAVAKKFIYEKLRSIWLPNRFTGAHIRPVYGADKASYSYMVHHVPDDFGEVPVGQSATQTIRITNSGNLTDYLNFSSVPDGFSVSVSSGTRVGPHSVVYVEITFKPTKEKTYSGTWKINNTDKAFNGNSKYMDIQLSGKGVKPPVDPAIVDLGLSVKWANHNVGATNPEDYGDFFAWAETATKSDFTWSNYKWGSSDESLSKYCIRASEGTVDNRSVIENSDDAARVNMGSDWRIPTKAEMDELLNQCTWTWTTVNGTQGFTVTGKNGNSIFLPAAGQKVDGKYYNKGRVGYYWTSTLSSSSGYAKGLYMYSSERDYKNYSRINGHSIRAVYDPTGTKSAAPSRRIRNASKQDGRNLATSVAGD